LLLQLLLLDCLLLDRLLLLPLPAAAALSQGSCVRSTRHTASASAA
jgi:hypothetical protein